MASRLSAKKPSQRRKLALSSASGSVIGWVGGSVVVMAWETRLWKSETMARKTCSLLSK